MVNTFNTKTMIVAVAQTKGKQAQVFLYNLERRNKVFDRTNVPAGSSSTDKEQVS
jgi:peroxiredoxin family protein